MTKQYTGSMKAILPSETCNRLEVSNVTAFDYRVVEMEVVTVGHAMRKVSDKGRRSKEYLPDSDGSRHRLPPVSGMHSMINSQ